MCTFYSIVSNQGLLAFADRDTDSCSESIGLLQNVVVCCHCFHASILLDFVRGYVLFVYVTCVQLGDIIVAIDNQDINTEADLFKILEERQPGDVISITAQRCVFDFCSMTWLPAAGRGGRGGCGVIIKLPSRVFLLHFQS